MQQFHRQVARHAGAAHRDESRERVLAAPAAALRWTRGITGIVVRVDGETGPEWWCPRETRVERLGTPAEIRALPPRARPRRVKPGGGTDRALPGWTTCGALYDEEDEWA